MNNTFASVNASLAKLIETDVNLTKDESRNLVDLIEQSALIIPGVNKSLVALNDTLVKQLLPVVATLQLQEKAEIDHHNQTQRILDSIGLSGNQTREQASLINQTEQLLGQDRSR